MPSNCLETLISRSTPEPLPIREGAGSPFFQLKLREPKKVWLFKIAQFSELSPHNLQGERPWDGGDDLGLLT
jgi:hypothetical protein